MSINTVGLNIMANGVANTANLELVATVGATEISTENVAFDAASGGVIEITGDVNIIIPSNQSYTISHVYLRVIGQSLSNHIAVATTTKTFTNGGTLIVESYEISVVSS